MDLRERATLTAKVIVKEEVRRFNAREGTLIVHEIALMIESALQSAVAEATAWQPIETAPKDGTPVIMGWKSTPSSRGGVAEGCFKHGKWEDWYRSVNVNPTHWRPLPEPPKPSSEPSKAERGEER